MIIAYLRVSTSEQTESGLGLEAQLEAISRTFGEPAAVFTDSASGAEPHREGLQSALAALKSGDTLVAAKRDRLARDVMLSCWIEKEAKRRGATVQTVDANGDNDDPTHVLMRRMVDAFAEYERAIIGARTKAALKAKRARGEKTGGACPFGYRAKNGKLIPHTEEQLIIQEAQTLRAEGQSLRQIAKTVGLKHPEQIRRLL